MSYNRIRNMRTFYSPSMVFLVWLLLPFTTTFAIFFSLCGFARHLLFRRTRWSHESHRKKILITGSSPAAISLAKSLRVAGNIVIGADATRFPFLPSARLSGAFHSFHNLHKQYKWPLSRKRISMDRLSIRVKISIPVLTKWKPRPSSGFTHDIVTLIEREKPDIWIPCLSSLNEVTTNDVLRAMQIVQRRALCAVLHADQDTTEMLTDESAFAEYIELLETGIRVPDSRAVTSRDELHRVLAACPDSRWQLEDMFDASASGSETATEDEVAEVDASTKKRWTWPLSPKSQRTDSDEAKDTDSNSMQLMSRKITLPLYSTNATYHCIAGMSISPDHPWTMRETIVGRTITTHLLVIRNHLHVFVASLPSKSPLSGAGEAEILPSTSLLHKPLALFAESFVANLPEDTSSFLSIDFIVSGTATTMGNISTLFPISCSVGVHPTAPTLMIECSNQAEKMANAVLAVVTSEYLPGRSKRNTSTSSSTAVALLAPSSIFATSLSSRGVYSFYPALMSLLVLPLLHALTGSNSFKSASEDMLSFFEKLLLWQEDLSPLEAPWFWWWEWHVRLPFAYFAERFWPGWS